MKLVGPDYRIDPQNSVRAEIAAHELCRVVGSKLEECYPGWWWSVECKWDSGVVTVKNLNLHGDYGFILHIRDVLHDTLNELPMKAGGELLERCNLPRGPRPEDTSFLKRDIKGNAIGDTHGAD